MPVAKEGRDYSVAQNGAWVFSREFLLSRGTCCGSKCTNCPFEHSKLKNEIALKRPVISMVPSWTETLVHSAVNLVGRTRFCIHPHDAVKSVPVLGGTKTLSADFDDKMSRIVRESAARGTKPLVILDREENPKSFFEYFSKYDVEIHVTHVASLESFLMDLRALTKPLAESLESAIYLGELARRTRSVMKKRSDFGAIHALLNSNVSAEDFIKSLQEPGTSILYFIWRNPWMIVNRDTWIESVLKLCFPNASLPTSVSRYTEFAENELEKQISEGSVLLFSSEPFPFAKNWDEVKTLPFVRKARAAGLVDGEVFSWFGIRSIRFLEDAQDPSSVG